MAYSRAKSKGRREKRPFHRIRTDLIRSQCWASLSTKSVKLFWDLFSQYNGFNNGDLAMTWPQMKKRGWRSKETLYAAVHELEDRGLVVQTRQGGKHVASLYAVTIEAIDECGGKLDCASGKLPTNAWKKWKAADRTK